MGMAMLFVILFHVFVPRSDAFFGLHRIGNVGVDMFLFLSGMGLWFSWCKSRYVTVRDRSFSAEYVQFYLKRLVRVYPAWLIIACLYYIPRFHGTTTWHWIDLFGEILFNWEFWIRDELTFWYVPAIMLLYVFAPPYMELIRRHPVYRWLVVAMVMWCILVQYVTPIHQGVGHLEIFWSRVPIFFLGINIGEMVRRRDTIDGQAIWLIILLFAMSFASSVWLEQQIHGRFPLFLERMLYIPLTITAILLLNILFSYTPSWLNRSVAWFGAISLETYLIHVQFVLRYLKPLHLGYWTTFLLCLLITIPLAWLLQRVASFVSSPSFPTVLRRTSHTQTTNT